MTETTDPIARECLREHASLDEQLTRVETLLRTPASVDASTLRGQLDSLHSLLERHMTSEEKPGGFMDQVRRRTARYDAALRELRNEHRRLSGDLGTLMTEAANHDDVPGPFAARLRSWTDSVRDHENRENHVLQEAFSVDLGAKD